MTMPTWNAEKIPLEMLLIRMVLTLVPQNLAYPNYVLITFARFSGEPWHEFVEPGLMGDRRYRRPSL